MSVLHHCSGQGRRRETSAGVYIYIQAPEVTWPQPCRLLPFHPTARSIYFTFSSRTNHRIWFFDRFVFGSAQHSTGGDEDEDSCYRLCCSSDAAASGYKSTWYALLLAWPSPPLVLLVRCTRPGLIWPCIFLSISLSRNQAGQAVAWSNQQQGQFSIHIPYTSYYDREALLPILQYELDQICSFAYFAAFSMCPSEDGRSQDRRCRSIHCWRLGEEALHSWRALLRYNEADDPYSCCCQG